MPRTIESSPLNPRAHLHFVSCVSTVLVARSNVDSIGYLPVAPLTVQRSPQHPPVGIGDAPDRVRKSRTPTLPDSRSRSAISRMSLTCAARRVTPCFRSPMECLRGDSRL